MALEEVATALTSVVLQQPGGPYNSTPLGLGRPMREKASGCLMGHSTAYKTFIQTHFVHKCFFTVVLYSVQEMTVFNTKQSY